MDWIKVTITTTKEGIDPVSGRLLNLGVNGIEITDKDDFQTFLKEGKNHWDYVDEALLESKDTDTTITLYLSDGVAGLEQLAAVRASMQELKSMDNNHQFGSLSVASDLVKDEDWSEIWKQYFHPIPVGDKVLIKPAWETVADAEGRTVFTVNPGTSFGTGSHPSTRFCIEEIEKYLKPDDTVLDLGCGSGILSIIALLLGANNAVAIDIDPNAVDVAYSNLALNGLSKDNYYAFAADVLTDEKVRANLATYDIVIANIVADVIIALSSFVRQFMKPNGIFISSGIILERLDEVTTALTEAGFSIVEVRKETDWACVTAR